MEACGETVLDAKAVAFLRRVLPVQLFLCNMYKKEKENWLEYQFTGTRKNAMIISEHMRTIPYKTKIR